MKRKAYSGKSTQIVKTSITLPEVLVRFIEGKMADDGYPTLSSYLVELLHRAKERDEERQLGLGKSSSSTSSYSPGRPQLNEIHDAAPATAPPAKKKRAA
jgi:Arc/MetJ-type ribon-helix-helix transcriptional regulator